MSANEEVDHRRQEINAFAAMAAGDYSSLNTYDVAAAKDDEKDSFAEAASQVEDSGTFSFTKPAKKDSNLEAAAAALADPPFANSSIIDSIGKPQIPLERSTSGVPPKKMKPRTPMHTQQVYLPKPMFFGPQIPPRIVEEARQIVAKALKEKGQDPDNISSVNINALPPSVRNLVGAFRTYGNGISILPRSEDDAKNRATPYVSVFCPKWSELQNIVETSPTTEPPLEEESTTVTESTVAETAAADSTQEQPLPLGAPAGQPTVEDKDVSQMSERDWFSMMARGENDIGSFGNASGSGTNKSSSESTQQLDNSQRSISAISDESNDAPVNRDLFSQWVNASSTSQGNSTAKKKNGDSERSEIFNSGTFLNLVVQDDSDEDSVVGSELKKKVGVNEHLNAAVASLEEDWLPSESNVPGVASGVEETPGITQIPLTKDGGRPLSNHELMDGSTPLFGVDDSSLPVETDLGIYETRDEQQRSREEHKIQAIIENVCPPNIFGSLACPSPAMNPDDTHSWKSRSGVSQRIVNPSFMGGNAGALLAPTSPPQTEKKTNKSPSTDKTSNRGKLDSSVHSKAPSTPAFPFDNKVYDPRSRFGWWNKQKEDKKAQESGEDSNDLDSNDHTEDLPLQLPPLDHSGLVPVIQAGLEPTPETLHKQNLPLSHLHPATSLAQALPFLSDRPPSYRYLQIDTQAVGFPNLGGEIEPLFCSLAIYHVESIGLGNKDPSMAPVPSWQRCGKVTETLNFDVVSDADIERRCAAALWPYGSEEGRVASQGTRCGVFPLPSNLSIHNLYAVIIVNKVISEGTDFEAYLRSGKSAGEAASRQDKINLESLRSRAEKASNQQGKFTMPFAFGVAPLLQVFGADVPLTPSSRAVQIPLFRFSSGLGERQIIDHIMVMLYPRADHSMSGIGGPAPVTNGGTAMLVMRNFGYLGLHSVVHSKSTLARDRLVDFTGELQLRRRQESESTEEQSFLPLAPADETRSVPEWQKDFISEATVHGGRNIHNSASQVDPSAIEASRSPLYAQELSPLLLHSVPSKLPSTGVSKSQRGRGTSSGHDIEPYYHTIFCNQLLCQPKVLHNCPKGNIVVKVELREVEWNAEFSAYFAHVPQSGSAIHNPRRGPFLVPGVFTSCSSRCVDPRFLEEFKVKLPLVLAGSNEDEKTRKLSLFFTVYKLSFSTRKKWARRLRGTKRNGQKADEIAGDLVGETSGETDSSGNCQLIQLACGHLPIAFDSSLVGNGNHEVKLASIARYPRQELCEKGVMSRSTLIVSDLADSGKGGYGTDGGRIDNDEATDSESVNSGHLLTDSASATSGTGSISRSDTTDDRKQRHGRHKSGSEPISLQVRISVQSSLHAQNSTLGEFFGQETGITSALDGLRKGNEKLSLATLSRNEIHAHFSSDAVKTSSQATAYDTDKLLISTVDISKPSMCSLSDVSSNLLRIILQLWKIAIAGTAEADLEWANPNSIIPLRIHAFATLLQLLGSSTVYLAKRGFTQLDGTNKWNLISLSRVLALLFDEGTMFGEHAEEPISRGFLAALDNSSKDPTDTQRKSSDEKKRRHVRSNFEFLNNSDTLLGDDSSANNFYGGSDILFSGRSHGSDFLSGARQESKPNAKLEKPFLAKSKSAGAVPSSTQPSWVDSVNDFKTALESGYREETESDELIHDSGSSIGNAAAQAMIKAFSGPAVGSKRWMTAPAPNLATISEDAAGDASAYDQVESQKNLGPLDSLDTELFLKPSKVKPKQMRVPNLKTKGAQSKDDTDVAPNNQEEDKPNGPMLEDLSLSKARVGSDGDSTEESTVEEKEKNRPRAVKVRQNTLPTTDDEIESAGISFLEAIERNFGLSGMNSSNPSGEENRVGQAHHRKTRSHCSIDWTIPNDDLNNLLADSPVNDLQKQDASSNELDMSMSTLSGEKEICTRLPSFVDRLLSLDTSGSGHERWFPFAYEIIIMQWLALLREQKASSPDARGEYSNKESRIDRDGSLFEAASRTGGVAIACAPVLFEIIKQSLGWRVANLFKRMDEISCMSYPALVTLDDTLLSSLEQLIFHVTDACLDSRNFDSWETRKTCIDVNDSIVVFLRDMFAFLDPTCVYRLIMVYMSSLDKSDDQVHNRDSKIGLRCSWEITKLKMNAISALVRFPDFIKVNSPQANSWGDRWTAPSTFSGTQFFDNVFVNYGKYEFAGFKSKDEDDEDSTVKIKTMVPHWLSGMVVEMCVLGLEHAEQNIQKRAAALLLELFWSQSQESLKDGSSSIVASMHITFLEKIISRTSYFSSCFHAKSQVRQDIIRCVIFVLQSAPSGLLRAVWRKLCDRASGKGAQDRFGGIGFAVFAESADDLHQENQRRLSRNAVDPRQDHDIFEMFSLLNLSLSTLEYEGTDDQADVEGSHYNDAPGATWREEYLVAREEETMDMARRRRLMGAYRKASVDEGDDVGIDYETSSSRKWHAHDGTIVAIKTAQQIVRELRFVLEPSEAAQSFFNPARRRRQHSSIGSHTGRDSPRPVPNFSYTDTVIFVRAATSVYLHSMALRQSDIVLVKTLNASVEIVKIFGIKIFNEAVGETLQHWMRVVSFHCGSRRAEVRVPASDFLELILRSTWDAFGSFFRIRVPFLAVQTEVMEQIVATATARHYRDQRKMGNSDIELFSNLSAEASLAPLWRTLDRLHHQSASQNVAFKSALIRLAEKLKKLFRAYIAAHALSFVSRSKPSGSPDRVGERKEVRRNMEAETLIRANRTRVHRVINASAGYSKQFLGFYSTSLEQRNVAHHEAVEDAFLDAADVFSPTELPDHRVAWLRKLAEFHESRGRFAEEATCHYQIYLTYKQASSLHGTLWSSTPFLPWTDNRSDGIHIDGEGPAAEDASEFDGLPEIDIGGRHVEKTNLFRRIFYRHENSIRNSGDLDAGTSKYAFFGVTLASEYHTVSPWITLREMEAHMLEEAEAAGELFLSAGIVASSQYVWSLASQFYAEKFSYGKLAQVYERLARTVVSQVPPVDSSLYQEVYVTEPVGRFYRVWFHGGAPDELMGAEFVYRTASTVTLDQFGKELREVVRCIVPEKTPIHLVLDGHPEESGSQNYGGYSRMGATLEPVRVKVTPLRPLMRKSARIRGLPEWFDDYIDIAFGCNPGSAGSNRHILHRSNSQSTGTLPHHRDHARSSSTSVFSSTGIASTMAGSRRPAYNDSRRFQYHTSIEREGGLVGADKFSFIQPINKGRSQVARDWLKGSSSDFAEKTLRVTQLQVGQAFPACVSRQVVVHRVVYTESPLEAAVEGICQWCAVLFRTAIATNGQAVLGINYNPGIGFDAAKVVSDSIHSSRVKEIGLYLLTKNVNVEEEEDGDVLQAYDRLGEDEVNRLQLKLARSLVVFLELVHLLIARNRNLLLTVIHERKSKGESGAHHSQKRSFTKGEVPVADARTTRNVSRQNSFPMKQDNASADGRSREDSTAGSHKQVHSMGSMSMGLSEWDLSNHQPEAGRARTDKAIGIQSELQRAFIGLAKDLYPMIVGIMGGGTPRWLKSACQDSYFSSSTYRNTKIPIGEELAFEDNVSPAAAMDDSRRDSRSVLDDSRRESRSALDDSRREPRSALDDSRRSRSISVKSQGSDEGMLGSIPNPSQRVSRNPSSPGGSLGSRSALSNSSEAARSSKSRKSYDRLSSAG